MRRLKHPLSVATYEIDDEGTVLVTRAGISGTFTRNGEWLHGDLRHADPELCRWVTSGNHPSPRLKASRRYTALTSKLTGSGS